MAPATYAFSAVDRVQCPRCGEMSEIELASNSGRDLEYAGVCASSATSGATCGTALRLLVIAHAFPRER